MHILIGVILILILLAVSKTLRMLAILGFLVVVGVAVLGSVIVSISNSNDAFSRVAVLLILGVVVLGWVILRMGVHVTGIASESLCEYADNRLKGKKHDESLKAAGGKAIDLLIEDTARIDVESGRQNRSGLDKGAQSHTSSIEGENQYEFVDSDHVAPDKELNVDLGQLQNASATKKVSSLNTEGKDKPSSEKRVWKTEGHIQGYVLRSSYSFIKHMDLYSQYFEPNHCCPDCGQELFVFQINSDFCVMFDQLGPAWNAHVCGVIANQDNDGWQFFLPTAFPSGILRGNVIDGTQKREVVVNYHSTNTSYWPNSWCGQPMFLKCEDDNCHFSTFITVDGKLIIVSLRGTLMTLK